MAATLSVDSINHLIGLLQAEQAQGGEGATKANAIISELQTMKLPPPSPHLDGVVAFMQQRFNRRVLTDGTMRAPDLVLLVNAMNDEAKRVGMKMPWQNHTLAIGSDDTPDSATYSMFPITDEMSWKHYCTQEASLWSAKEVPYLVDKEQFPLLPVRYQELVYDLLGFFAPGDGLVSTNIFRMISECTTYAGMMFFIVQLFSELVHSEGYGMYITAVVPEKKEQKRIFGMVNDLPCVKAKAEFMKRNITSYKSPVHRDIATCCTERIFFVALFAIIFYFRTKTHNNKKVLDAFVFLNEQISKDESIHAEFYADRARAAGLPPLEEIYEIVEEAVNIEMAHVEYIMRKPIDSPEIDAAAGMTIENLKNYARLLGNQVYALLGVPSKAEVKCEVKHLKDMGLSRKTNFYEGKVGNYAKFKDGADWRKHVGQTAEISTSAAVADPSTVDF